MEERSELQELSTVEQKQEIAQYVEQTGVISGNVWSDKAAFDQAVIDATHMVKTATVLAHPIAPASTENVMKFMNLPESVFSWDNIFDSIDKITDEGHKFNVLEPKSDFYTKPEWQY